MLPDVVFLVVCLGAVVVSGQCSTGTASTQCFSENSQCMSNCAAMDPLYSSNCFSSCSSNLNVCTAQASAACSGVGGGVASGGGVGGGGGAATPTTFLNFIEECQAILQANDNPAFINVADLQILVDGASRGNCDNKATLLVEPMFVDMANLSSCGQCLAEDGSQIVDADGNGVGCCNDLTSPVVGDGSELCGVVNLIIQSDCLSNFCVPSQVPDCVNAADTCRNACLSNTPEETYACAEACIPVFAICVNTCFASLLNTEKPQTASTGVGKSILRVIMFPSLLASAFFLVA